MATDLTSFSANLRPTPGGWWTVALSSPVSYPEDGNSLCFAVEDDSFWFRHRNRCLVDLVRRFPAAGTLFDIGGGNGCVAAALQSAGHDVALVEPGLTGVRNALARGIRLVVHSTLQDLGTLTRPLPAAGLFDVLEHIPDDRAFLNLLHSNLAPSARLYITVPAHPWLWSHEDILAGHHRRYSLDSLSRLLSLSGFVVEFASYYFSFLPLPVLAGRVLPFRLGLRARPSNSGSIRQDHRPGSPLAGKILDALTRREFNRLASGAPLSSGASCLVACRRR